MALRYPYDVSEAGRPRRLSPLHARLEALGAVFGTKNGWERADYFRPGEPSRRAGEEQRANQLTVWAADDGRSSTAENMDIAE